MTTKYISLSEADDYFSERNSEEWAALSDQVKLGALVRATEYINAMYEFVVDVNPPPDELKHATAMLALMSTEKDLNEPEDFPIDEAKVGPVRVSYDTNWRDVRVPPGSSMRFAYIDALLRGIARRLNEPQGVGIRLVS